MGVITSMLAALAAAAAAVALAFVPMKFLTNAIAKNIRQFVERQRDRRRVKRDSPDRRKAA